MVYVLIVADVSFIYHQETYVLIHHLDTQLLSLMNKT